MSSVHDLFTPAVLIDQPKLQRNILSMQSACDAASIALRPHIKTHKMVPIAKMQLAAGAAGLTCAKIGEAEAMLPSGVKEIFLAHSLVDLRQAPRLAALIEQLKELRVAVTSEAHVAPLARLAQAVGKKFTVMMAIDTGLGREGARGVDSAQRLARLVAQESQLQLAGFYTHEGHFYGVTNEQRAARTAELLDRLVSARDAIDPSLPLWPGCSVTAREIIHTSAGRVQVVRPGAYIFGDLALTTMTEAMKPDDVALHVLATVVDLPEPGLALIDAGSKTFSSDRTRTSIFAVASDGRDLSVAGVNEEHGYVRGRDVAKLAIGERLTFTPAHVCTVVNLTDNVSVLEGEKIVATWKVDARGCTR